MARTSSITASSASSLAAAVREREETVPPDRGTEDRARLELEPHVAHPVGRELPEQGQHPGADLGQVPRLGRVLPATAMIRDSGPMIVLHATPSTLATRRTQCSTAAVVSAPPTTMKLGGMRGASAVIDGAVGPLPRRRPGDAHGQADAAGRLDAAQVTGVDQLTRSAGQAADVGQAAASPPPEPSSPRTDPSARTTNSASRGVPGVTCSALMDPA